MVRQGLGAFILAEPDLELLGEAANGREALRRCEESVPDVVLMDLMMPVMDGVATIQALHARWPEVRVIALTSFYEQELVQEAMRAGATSYLLKNVAGEELAAAIRAARAGRATLAPEATQALIQAATQEPGLGFELTAREREVLALMVEGLSNQDIAERLTVSYATAKAHVGNILSKLGAANRAEAVALALRHKLVS